jgi:hypothetical protein
MASALDLLLSRQAAAAGVGIGTRRNRVLPAPTPTTGNGLDGKPLDVVDDIPF